MNAPRKRSAPHGWPAEWPIPDVADRNETARFLLDEAHRLMGSQRALEKAELISSPPPEEQRAKIMAFYSASLFIGMCAPHRAQVIALLRQLDAKKKQ